MAERELVSVQTVSSVAPIEGADRIEAVGVRGWTVVCKKGEFVIGQPCLYFEIDSFLPVNNPIFAFLEARGTKTVDDVVGHVLKTAKLRGVYSQGLIVSLSDVEGLDLGADLAAQLGVVKYDPPVPAQLRGITAGPYLSAFAPKTDAERVQNLTDWYPPENKEMWIPTEKVDGTSVTYINDDGRLRVCSRNWELAPSGGTQWRLAEQVGMLDLLSDGQAAQAELYGEGIQSNRLGVKGQKLAVFGVWDNRTVLPREMWPEPLQKLSTPVYDMVLPDTVEQAIFQADGVGSLVTSGRLAEGIVWHHRSETFDALGGRGCFKVVSNKWLMRNG